MSRQEPTPLEVAEGAGRPSLFNRAIWFPFFTGFLMGWTLRYPWLIAAVFLLGFVAGWSL